MRKREEEVMPEKMGASLLRQVKHTFGHQSAMHNANVHAPTLSGGKPEADSGQGVDDGVGEGVGVVGVG